MYFVKFTITDLKTKETKIKESEPTTYNNANDIIYNYLKNTSNVINIKCLGGGAWIVYKNGGTIKCEIIKK